MMKHVGRHGEKKVAIVFREVPGEDHMALVCYPDQLQQNLHDDLMNAIQSHKGQEARDLGEALHGITGTNGSTILNTLHREGFMKKVRTQDIILTPAPNQPGARLDEINKIIRDLDTGSDAAKRMAELDANAGLADPDKKAAGVAAAAAIIPPVQSTDTGILNDSELAKNLVAQAEAMKSQMNNLQLEVNRLLAEAADLDPSIAPKKKRGRPAKVTTS